MGGYTDQPAPGIATLVIYFAVSTFLLASFDLGLHFALFDGQHRERLLFFGIVCAPLRLFEEPIFTPP